MKKCRTKEGGRTVKHSSGPTTCSSNECKTSANQHRAAAFSGGAGNTSEASRTETNLDMVTYGCLFQVLVQRICIYVWIGVLV